MSKEYIIAIDGPSGAGKSTLSKKIAKTLGYTNIDTGAMYRCIALAAARRGIDPDDTEALAKLSRSVQISFVSSPAGEKVLLNSEDVSSEIRTPETSLMTPKIAAIPDVRASLVELQRDMGRSGGVVLEGRDIGSVVFPDAEVKIFLIATAEERGRRRFAELSANGTAVDLAKTIADIEQRDRIDSNRSHSPLVKASDAIEIDTTGLTIDQVHDRILQVVQNRGDQPGDKQ